MLDMMGSVVYTGIVIVPRMQLIQTNFISDGKCCTNRAEERVFSPVRGITSM